MQSDGETRREVMKRMLAGLTGAGLVASGNQPCMAQGRGRPRGNRGRMRRAEPIKDVGAELASHKELKPLGVKFGNIMALRMNADGNLLVADGQAKAIKVVSPEGKVVDTVSPGFRPEALAIAADGTIYCGGEGELAKLTPTGKIIKKVSPPAGVGSSVNAVSRRRARGRPTRVSGMAVSDKDVFVTFGSGWSLGAKSKLYRFDLEFGHPKVLATGLRGCCQRCDIAFRDGVLYLAENAAHRVVCYDREGRILRKWGTRSRTGLDGFGSCCNPMNLCFDAAGVLYTAESGLGRIKRYTTDGRFLGLVGYVGVERFTRAGQLAASCSNIAIATTRDGRRVYVMDFKQNTIRVLEKKG